VTPTPELSIIVCTHNGARTLPIALDSLGTQTLSAERYEIVVVDDGSTDGSGAVARASGVRAVRLEPNAGLAAARNAGITAARGSIVAFTDDDCEVDRGWAAALLAAFTDPTVDGVGGAVEPASSSPFLQRFLRANNPLVPLNANLLDSTGLSYRLLLYLRRTLTDVAGPSSSLYSVVGANMAFRRDVLLALDGFDEAFRFGSEEEDFCLRLHRHRTGAKLRYVPDALVTHWFRPGIRDSIRRSRAYGHGNARRHLKHPDTKLIVYPTPLLVGVSVLAGLATRRSGLLAAAAGLPLITYPRWAPQALHARSPEPIVYPYLILAQEIAGMLGERDGVRAGYERTTNAYLETTSSSAE
jgi:glycosyltransferase involved in cell wall biosynthesis